jgi:hypothetical protein
MSRIQAVISLRSQIGFSTMLDQIQPAATILISRPLIGNDRKPRIIPCYKRLGVPLEHSDFDSQFDSQRDHFP